MTFDDANSEAEQVFELSHDYNGDLEYATKYVCWLFAIRVLC